MLLQRPFEALTPTVDGDVLEVLARADSSFTTSQLQGLLSRYSYSGVRKVLERLTRQGVVTSERYGSTDVFRLNRQHLAAGPILELANLRATFVRRLKSLIADWSQPPVYAALFGSAARAQMHETSDIDLFVVRPANLRDEDPTWLAQLDHLQSHVTAWTGNDARVLEYAHHDLLEAWNHEPLLWNVREDAIKLYGDRNYWRELKRGGKDW